MAGIGALFKVVKAVKVVRRASKVGRGVYKVGRGVSKFSRRFDGPDMPRGSRGFTGGVGSGSRYSTGIEVHGLQELQQALDLLESNVGKDLAARLQEIGRQIEGGAQRNAPVRSGALRSSIQSSAYGKGATVSSGLPYAQVQDAGGPVGKGAVLSGSRYMSHAQRGANVDGELEKLLDQIERDFDSGRLL